MNSQKKWRCLLAVLLVGCPKGTSTIEQSAHAIVHPRWATSPSAVEPDTLRRLEALGYAEWTELELAGGERQTGVVFYDEARAYDSLSLYKSRPRHEAHLMDMRGRILHTWRASDREADGWDFVELSDDGHLFASVKYEYLEKLDWNSEVLWKVPIRSHHDLDIDDDGRVFVLVGVERDVTIGWDTFPLKDNDIVILSPEGVEERRIRLSTLFGDRISRKLRAKMRWPREKKHYWDVFHTNSIELLERDVAGVGRRGDVLISIRELDTIAVVDLNTPRVVRSWGPGILDRPHHPSLLPDGGILVFDNGRRRRWSRVLELAPSDGSPTWELRGDPQGSFYTSTRGSAERLSGGNTLVVESAKGHVFEVTREGDVVWEFFNPDIDSSKGKKRRAAIYRMPRLDRALVEKLPLDRDPDGYLAGKRE